MRVMPKSDKFDRILTEGLNTFTMTLAALARIEGNTYELVAVKSDTGVYVAGEKFVLGDSFCRRVLKLREPIAESAIEQSPPVLKHPLYSSLPLECYIGAPVYRHGEIWGCLDFTSLVQRDEPFSARDLRLICRMARQASEIVDAG